MSSTSRKIIDGLLRNDSKTINRVFSTNVNDDWSIFRIILSARSKLGAWNNPLLKYNAMEQATDILTAAWSKLTDPAVLKGIEMDFFGYARIVITNILKGEGDPERHKSLAAYLQNTSYFSDPVSGDEGCEKTVEDTIGANPKVLSYDQIATSISKCVNDERLSGTQRVILYAKFEGVSSKEIASQIKKKPGNVDVIHHRVKQTAAYNELKDELIDMIQF